MEKDTQQNIIRRKIVKVNGDDAYKEYVKIKLLGRGGFANCYLTRNLETQALSATKIISKSLLTSVRTKLKLQNEIKIHKMLYSQHVVKFYEAFQDNLNVYVVMELCQNNSLNQYMNEKKKLSIAQSQKFITQLTQGIKYLHSQKIIHRDFKLGNVFLGQQNQVKIGDFGLATKLEFQQEKKRTLCGTPNYLAPQIIQCIGYGYQVDIWSLGIMLFTFLVGTPPFETDDFKLTYEKIQKSEYCYNGAIIPDVAKQFISKLLSINPANRPTVQQILESDFLKYGKSLILQPSSSSVLVPIQNIVKVSSNPFITSFSEIKQGFCYLLSNGVKGIITNKQCLLIPNSSQIYLVDRDRIDKIKKTTSSQLDQNYSNLRLVLQSVKFIIKNPSTITKNTQKLVYVRKYIMNKNMNIFRMSNQTVHFLWNDGYYAIANKNNRIWITDGNKITQQFEIIENKNFNKIMKSKIELIKQCMNKS